MRLIYPSEQFPFALIESWLMNDGHGRQLNKINLFAASISIYRVGEENKPKHEMLSRSSGNTSFTTLLGARNEFHFRPFELFNFLRKLSSMTRHVAVAFNNGKLFLLLHFLFN